MSTDDTPGDKPVKLVRKRLDADGVNAHFQALAATAQQPEIRIKGGATRQSDATSGSLDEVVRQLVAGEIVGVQVRFFDAGDWWIDTVMRARDGFRLVRMREGA
jgi:hypothetical protein